MSDSTVWVTAATAGEPDYMGFTWAQEALEQIVTVLAPRAAKHALNGEVRGGGRFSRPGVNVNDIPAPTHLITRLAMDNGSMRACLKFLDTEAGNIVSRHVGRGRKWGVVIRARGQIEGGVVALDSLVPITVDVVLVPFAGGLV